MGLYWLRGLDERMWTGRSAAAGLAAAHVDGQLYEDLEVLQRLAAAVGPQMGDADLSAERHSIREAHHHFKHRESVFLLDAERNVLGEEPPGSSSTAPRPELAVVDDVLRSGLP
ncbi:MAG TPA: hypothetical protein VIV54_01040, partial [Burkholderiales bacterium]